MVEHLKRLEFERNFAAFTEVLPSLLPSHEGQFALMRHGNVVECFDTPREALQSGRKQFADDLFSVQTVTDQQADFGWYSRAPDNGTV